MNLRSLSLGMFFLLTLGGNICSLYAAQPQVPASPAPAAFDPGKVIMGIVAFNMCLPLAAKCYKGLRSLILRMQKIGVVTISGVISDSAKNAKQLQDFFKDPSIKAIVLKINSGGGAPGASQALYHIVSELKKVYKKPVIAWVENIAASGAYYIAAAADVIVATPSAMVGSIGVISSIIQLKDFMKRFDIEHEIITAGQYKAGTYSFNDMTPEQRQAIQGLCDSVYERFIADMQKSRPQLTELSPEVWANGRIFDADTGITLGLVDRIGSQLTLEEVIKEYTGKNSEIEWVYPVSSTSSLIAQLFGAQPEGEEGSSYVSALVDSVYTRVAQRMEESAQLRVQLTS